MTAIVLSSDAFALSRLQIHLSEEHGPLGAHPSVTGKAWTDLALLEEVHRKLHATRPWAHSHPEMA